MQPRIEVADVLDQCWDRVEQAKVKLNTWQIRTLRALKDCRTSALGGHIDSCTSCGHIQLSYNSCRNRHCPKCQGHKKGGVDTSTTKRPTACEVFSCGVYTA